MVSSVCDTSACNLPNTVSYFNKWAAVLAPMEPTLMATMSNGFDSRFNQHLKTLRPMRPKPLMAVFVELPAAIAVVARTCWALARPVWGQRLTTVNASPEEPTKPPLPTAMLACEEPTELSRAGWALAEDRPRAHAAAPAMPTAAPSVAVIPAAPAEPVEL